MNLLRPHTTAVSSRMLYALGQGPFAPKRYYSIYRVFRNEAVDRTHLAEFHQIEGLICDRGLTLGHLIKVVHDFFSHLGMSKLEFKPAYDPYPEPSMEIFRLTEIQECLNLKCCFLWDFQKMFRWILVSSKEIQYAAFGFNGRDNVISLLICLVLLVKS